MTPIERVNEVFERFMWATVAPKHESDIRAHLPMLYNAARGKRVIELGVGDGTSTSAFLAAMAAHGGHLLSIDINQECNHFAGHPCWTFIAGDSLDARLVPQGHPVFDVLFIDTDHTKERTLGELELWVKCLKSDGVIYLHDAENPMYPGVAEAVSEFCRQRAVKLTTHRGSFGMFEIGPNPAAVGCGTFTYSH